uniref:Uncharacterized protein n=1 Tax=Arundo donax TaxID=35708 RepID=A0A0A9BRH5_ARUDO
MLLDNPILLA